MNKLDQSESLPQEHHYNSLLGECQLARARILEVIGTETRRLIEKEIPLDVMRLSYPDTIPESPEVAAYHASQLALQQSLEQSDVQASPDVAPEFAASAVSGATAQSQDDGAAMTSPVHDVDAFLHQARANVRTLQTNNYNDYKGLLDQQPRMAQSGMQQTVDAGGSTPMDEKFEHLNYVPLSGGNSDMTLFGKYFQQKRQERMAEIYSALIHHEAKIGGELFGPIPEGHRREFFCLDDHTWVWHEEWKDENDQWQAVTTRYDVRPGGILKSQGGASYQRLSKQELLNLYKAVTMYEDKVGSEQQRILQAV